MHVIVNLPLCGMGTDVEVIYQLALRSSEPETHGPDLKHLGGSWNGGGAARGTGRHTIPLSWLLSRCAYNGYLVNPLWVRYSNIEI